MPKLPTTPKPPKPEEQIRPDALIRTIKKEKPPTGEKLKDIPITSRNYHRFIGKDVPPLPRGIIWGIIGVVALFVIGSIVSFIAIKHHIKASIASQAATLQSGVADLQNFDPQSAAGEFGLLAGSSTLSFTSVLGMFGSLFQGGSNAIGAFQDLASQLTGLSGEFAAMQNDLFGASGGSLVAELSAVRGQLAAIDADTNELSGSLSSGGGFYLPVKAQLEGAETFLTSFIPWFASATPHHILVLFQNPSEMRPGGGFLGSYADVTIASGTITAISVRDIADVDAGFPVKIIPPVPLQLEASNFRPADANWFFDFPTSASETLALFSESKLYAGSTTFDGVIALSPKVVSDLLSVTGPITILSTATESRIASTTFTSDNFLVKVQNIVQQGQAQSDAGTPSGAGQATYPKAIIGKLARQIFDGIASSTDAQKQELFAMALDWVKKKDVMAYFTDPAFENFITTAGADGAVYALPQNFNGDYLAIADANIRGDKSDLYVSQNVGWTSTIDPDGTITDNLTISRTHTGNTSPYWWYQTTNQDYLQLFVPPSSALADESGGLVKSVPAPLNYARSGYSTDPLIAAIVSSTQSLLLWPAIATHTEDGKEVFATWSRVAAGNTAELSFDYSHRAYLPPADGVAYQFVFEKQPGSVRSYDFTFNAPLGYVFAENNLASYEYISDDPPGRLIINLTLKKL